MKQRYALLLCVTIMFVNLPLYAMDNASNSKNTAILQALRERKPCVHIKQLLEQGADPNGIQGDLQNNPLACLLDYLGERYGAHSSVEIAKLLLEHGADPNACPYIAITAAKCSGKMLKLLLSKGMKLDAYESVGGKGTPLTEAIAKLEGHARIKRVLKLIKAGAPVQDGCALLEAAAQGSEEMVKILFAYKCSPDALVRKYFSDTGAMDCTRDEGNACDLYLEFCKGWHPDLLPSKHMRIAAMFEKAQTDIDIFAYNSPVTGIFDVGNQFLAIKSAKEYMWALSKCLFIKMQLYSANDKRA